MPLANCLFFIHIPKTAGTSLRLALEQSLGKEHICYDYGPPSPHTEPDIARLGYPVPDMYRVERALAPKHYKLIGGHVPAMRYLPMIPVTRSFTFIRNPVDQLMSHYAHYVRHHGYKDTLAAFIKTAMAGPIATKMLTGVPIETIGFVGVTEEYETSLSMLSDLFGLNIPIRYDNRNPAKQEENTYAIPDEIKDAVAKLLKPEFALWNRAQMLLQERKKAAEKGYDYVHGGIQLLNANLVAGFAYNPKHHRPIRVNVRVNGKPLPTPTVATLHRPGLQWLRVPRNGCVGFDIRFPTALKPGDMVTCFLPATGQILDERVF